MIDIAIAAAARLQDSTGDLFRIVGTVADYESLSGMPRSVPAAYVLPLAEQADRNQQLSPGTLQLHRCRMGVILFAHHAGDASGSRSVTALHDLREAVQAALVAWMPSISTQCTPAVFVGGELIDATAGTTVWRDEFEVDRYVSRTAPSA